jgi:hypothetical protein
MNKLLVIDRQNYYSLANGNQVADITNHLDFNLGSAIKYIYRAGKKGKSKYKIIRFFEKIYYSIFKRKSKQVEDLRKAYTFLNYSLKQEEYFISLAEKIEIIDKRKREKYTEDEVEEMLGGLEDDFFMNIESLKDNLTSKSYRSIISFLHLFIALGDKHHLESAIKLLKENIDGYAKNTF